MKKELERLVEEYNEKQVNVQNIRNQMEELRLEFEKKMEPYKIALSNAEQEQDCFGKQIVASVRLGDLVEELSELTGISIKNIDYKVDIRDELIVHKSSHGLTKSKNEFLKDKPVKLDLKIRGSKKLDLSCPTYKAFEKLDFCYDISFYSLLTTLQADGKSLFDHTYTWSAHIEDMPWKNKFTKLAIKEDDMCDIICNFSLFDLAYFKDWDRCHPKRLLLEAVLNIVGRQKENKNKKKILSIFHR